MNENDYLIYCDAGCTINSVGGEIRFYEYINMLKESKFGILIGKNEWAWVSMVLYLKSFKILNKKKS